MFCMSLLQKFPQNFEFKRLILPEKIKIADINIILDPSQKCVIHQIEVKMLGKN
jgi:predicted dinucleotide-utilizing enzyme